MNPDHYDTPTLTDFALFAVIMLKWPMVGMALIAVAWWLS